MTRHKSLPSLREWRLQSHCHKEHKTMLNLSKLRARKINQPIWRAPSRALLPKTRHPRIIKMTKKVKRKIKNDWKTFERPSPRSATC